MTEGVAPPVSHRAAFAGAGAAMLLGGLGLLGWVTPWPLLAKLQSVWIPMAPSTALGLLLLGGALIRAARKPSSRWTTAVSLLVLAFTGLNLAMFALGRSPALDPLLVPDAPVSGGLPTGRMSPWTALGLTLVSLGLLVSRLGQRPSG